MLQSCPPNVGLGWKVLIVTNALAYYDRPLSHSYTANAIKVFFLVTDTSGNKLECFTLESVFGLAYCLQVKPGRAYF